MAEGAEVVKRVGGLLFGGPALRPGPSWLSPAEEPRIRLPLLSMGRVPLIVWEELERCSPKELAKALKRWVFMEPISPSLLLAVLEGRAQATRAVRVGGLVLGGAVFAAYPKWAAPAEDPGLKVWFAGEVPVFLDALGRKRGEELLAVAQHVARALEREGMRVSPGLLAEVLEGRASALEAFRLHLLGKL